VQVRILSPFAEIAFKHFFVALPAAPRACAAAGGNGFSKLNQQY
jgi:hypothetical protein